MTTTDDAPAAIDWQDRAGVHALLRPLPPRQQCTLLEGALRQRGEDRFLHGLLGIALFNSDDPQRAEHHLLEGLENHAGDASLLLHLALIERKAGNLAASTHWLERSIDARPSGDTWAILMQTLEELEDWPTAARQSARAHAAFPDDPRLLVAVVNATAHVRDAASALAYLDAHDDGSTPALAELRYRLLHRDGRQDLAMAAHDDTSRRYLVQQPDYRQRARQVIEAVPAGWQREALVAQWRRRLRALADAMPAPLPDAPRVARARRRTPCAGPPRLAMSILVRDEADIIAENIRYHAACGVEHFIVTDNASVDGTRELLESLRGEVSLEIIDESSHTIDQDLWVTRMARRLQAEKRWDWVIHNDADEFWVPEHDNLPKAILATLHGEGKAADVGVLACKRHNMLCNRNDLAQAGYRFDDNVFRVERTLGLQPGEQPWNHGDEHIVARTVMDKVMTRLDGLQDVEYGNHGATHRAGFAACNAVTVLHYPVRTFAQFERKVVNYGESLSRNTRFSTDSSRHLRFWYERHLAGLLETDYAQITFEGTRLAGLLAHDQVSIDRRVQEALTGEQRVVRRALG